MNYIVRAAPARGSVIRTSMYSTSNKGSIITTATRKFIRFRRIFESSYFYKGISFPFQNWWFGRLVRAVRIGVIALTIYQAGYQAGMVHFAQNPKKVEHELIRWVLEYDEDENIEDLIHSTDSAIYRRISSVASRILISAREHAAEQLRIAELAIENSPPTISIEEENLLHSTLNLWIKASHRLSGNWTYVVSKKDQVNAFVTGFLPRRIFVFEGLVTRLKLTDDELAMILAHELSHVVLGHTEEEVPMVAIMLATQLILMSCVDPTGGIWSYLFDDAIAYIRQYITATHSRLNEHAADELGLILASKSCYDVTKGAEVHGKLALIEGTVDSIGLLDSHPASTLRHENLKQLAQAHERDIAQGGPRYDKHNRDCMGYRKVMLEAGLGRIF